MPLAPTVRPSVWVLSYKIKNIFSLSSQAVWMIWTAENDSDTASCSAVWIYMHVKFKLHHHTPASFTAEGGFHHRRVMCHSVSDTLTHLTQYYDWSTNQAWRLLLFLGTEIYITQRREEKEGSLKKVLLKH